MKNPNAIVGGGAGLTGGALVLFLLSLVGVHVDNYVAAAIAALIGAVVLWVGKLEKGDGLLGLWNRLIHGSPKPQPPSTGTPTTYSRKVPKP